MKAIGIVIFILMGEGVGNKSTPVCLWKAPTNKNWLQALYHRLALWILTDLEYSLTSPNMEEKLMMQNADMKADGVR